MPEALTDEQIFAAMKECAVAAAETRPHVPQTTLDTFRDMCVQAFENEPAPGRVLLPGTLAFGRAKQASYAMALADEGLLETRGAEVSTFLRWNSGSGRLFEPKQGLIAAILTVDRELMSRLDLAGIRHAAYVSEKYGVVARANLKAQGPADEAGRMLEMYPGATLVGEIVLGDDPPPDSLMVRWAKTIVGANTEFALSNVVSGASLSDALATLDADGLKPRTADLTWQIGRDLGMPDATGTAAGDALRDVLEAAKSHDVQVMVTAVAVGTKEARRDLFQAVTDTRFPLELLLMSGRDLMKEIVNLGRQLPTHAIDFQSGEIVRTEPVTVGREL